MPPKAVAKLGEGTYGRVDLVDCGGELLDRKQFYYEHLTEAYVLALLQGAGGTPILKEAMRKPLTIFMSYCGVVTLGDFLAYSQEILSAGPQPQGDRDPRQGADPPRP